MVRNRAIQAVQALLMCIAALVIWGCAASGADNSRLTAGDIIDTVGIVRQSLAESQFLSGRTMQGPPIRLGLAEPTNRSGERLAASDRWAIAGLVVYDRGIQDLLASRNVRLYLPEETLRALEQSGGDGTRPMGITLDPPEYILRTEIRSIARQGSLASTVSDQRLDVYLIDYRITGMNSSEIAWSKAVELARQASGTVAD